MKSGQSILELLNLLTPLESKPPLSNSEAQLLYNIWKMGERDNYGRIVVSTGNSSLNVLKSKDMIQISPALNGLAVNITPKGKEIIRKIILFGEQSSFNESDGAINFEQIHRHSKNAPKKKTKVACLLENSHENWLQKICK